MNTRTLDSLATLILGLFIVDAACAQSTSPPSASFEYAEVRPADCAGSWYPRDPDELRDAVDNALVGRASAHLAGTPRAIIAPHAGYRWSAYVSGEAYRYVKGGSYDRVIVLAFSHRLSNSYEGVDVPESLDAYQTPLGFVPIDKEACGQLAKNPLFSHHPGVERGEHSLELQLPFLQRALKTFKLVPLLVGRMSEPDYVTAAEAILPLVDDKTLLVASSDFTHYGHQFNYVPFADDIKSNLGKLAERAAAPIEKCDYDGFDAHLDETRDTICGRHAIKLLLRILSMRGGADGGCTWFDTSGKMTGDYSNSVTYQSFVFMDRKGKLDTDAQQRLLQLARDTVTAHLTGKPLPAVKPEDLPVSVRADGGCFVTLENHGELRGCIGNTDARDPLYKAVMRNAVLACRDSRFVNHPITAAELPQLHVEISYLTPLERVANPNDIVVGTHGLVIERGRDRGLLLPQVAYSRGWSREEFLNQTCRKARLPMDAWRRPGTTIYSFEAQVFGEPTEGAER